MWDIFFQLSFSTTATTIVSGAMAERTKLSAYIIFSLLNTLIYCIPAHWIWAESGFLFKVHILHRETPMKKKNSEKQNLSSFCALPTLFLQNNLGKLWDKLLTQLH